MSLPTRLRFALTVFASPYLVASSLSGIVKNEGFVPISGAEVALQRKYSVSVRTSTDEHGTFTFSDLQPGEYSVLVNYPGFINHREDNIHINDGEDFRLFRILLETGEAYGNCVVHLTPGGAVRHTNAQDVEVAGRVVVRHGQYAEVTLNVFTENDLISDSVASDNKGRFHFVAPVAGDVRLKIEILDGAGEVVAGKQEANVWRTKLGDRLVIPMIRLNEAGLGHFCY
jgi:hypothetical protein